MSRNKAKNCRNEVKSYIARKGMTMTETVKLLADEHGWSSSIPQPVRKATARVAQIRRSCGTGRCI